MEEVKEEEESIDQEMQQEEEVIEDPKSVPSKEVSNSSEHENLEIAEEPQSNFPLMQVIEHESPPPKQVQQDTNSGK